MIQPVEHIPVSAIDRADTGFRISGAGDGGQALAASLDAAGLSMPLLVCLKEEAFVLVSGFRRFEAALALGWDTVACRVARETAPADLARQAVAENTFQRELGPGELLRAVRLLGRYMTVSEMADQAPALLNTRLNTGYIESLFRILDLPDTVLDFLDDGRLSLKAAKLLAGMDPADAKGLIDLFSLVRVSSSKQTEIITWTREICAREGISAAALCSDKAIQAIFAESGKGHHDLAALGNRLRRTLFQRRFPALDAAKQRSLKALRSLNLPRGIRVDLPENFESMVYSLQFDFTSLDGFKAQVDAVKELGDLDGFKALLER